MEHPFYLTNGELSAYGLACGYVEQRNLAPDCQVELYQDGGHYHVKMYAQVHSSLRRVLWEVFDTLTPARAFYHQTIRDNTP